MSESFLPSAARAARVGVGIVLAAALGGCGGGGSPSAPTPPAPTRSLVVNGSFQLVSVAAARRVGLPVDAARGEFTTSASGTLDATIDWTSAANPVGFGIYQGSCSFSQWYASQCIVVAERPAGNSKPASISVPGVPAGSYTIVVANAGNSSESGTYQIFLTH